MKKNSIFIETVLIFICSFIFYWLTLYVSYDDIWNYGFAYNIANNLIPYKDFNMVITPFYPMLASIFLRISSSMFMFYFVNSVVNALMFYLIRKEKGNSSFLFMFFVILFCSYGYNLFLMLLFILIMYMENKKQSPFLIGVISSLAVLTKQSVFPFLTIALFLGSDRKSIKYRILGYLLPFLIFLIYLLTNNSLYYFIDYCFLGLKSFGTQNFTIKSICLLIIFTLINGYLFYLLVKSKFKNKELLYILSFQIIAFPIFEVSHVCYCLFLDSYYILNKFRLNKKSIIMLIIMLLAVPFINAFIHIESISIKNNLELFKGRPFDKNIDNYIYDCIKKIKTKEFDDLYIFDSTSYIIKLEMGIPINKYDLINNGNMGKNGAEKYIEEIKKNCIDKKCLFVIRNYKKGARGQTSIEILNYVKNNYKLTERVNAFEFYENIQKNIVN